MATKLYLYGKCSTCRAALEFLRRRGIAVECIPIREQPPTRAELRRMLDLQGGDLRRLFNVSGQDYRAMGLKEKLPSMSKAEALSLLHSNGNLVKRPFLLTENSGATGFNEDRWRELFP